MVNNIGSSPDSESHSYKVGEATNSGPSGDGCIKEQDRLLPIANVGRIMKQILPPNAKVSKEAKETMQECVSEFISFVTGEASDKCRKEKRKTVNGDDICWALGTLGFDDYAETLKRYWGFEEERVFLKPFLEQVVIWVDICWGSMRGGMGKRKLWVLDGFERDDEVVKCEGDTYGYWSEG
ncbi:hypothetical protein MRB53_029138 [Persea americana]|uniref:Uncharacterized protein n=1 Tax=Persea americana TaxID=3435 RepID=A0ACC2KI28_PERAE|nr:hypothetical protein MRB53_029138 [Persea americana]